MREKIGTQMDVELLAELREFAKAEGRQIQYLIEKAVRAYLEKHASSMQVHMTIFTKSR